MRNFVLFMMRIDQLHVATNYENDVLSVRDSIVYTSDLKFRLSRKLK